MAQALITMSLTLTLPPPLFSSMALILARAASRASISMSMFSGKCGTSRKLSVIRRATVLRMPSSGMRS